MDEHLIVGSITLPYSLSNSERLLWLEDWILQSSLGIKHSTKIEVMFLKESDIASSVKFLLNSSKWVLSSSNEFFAPDGTIITFLLDKEAEKLLNQFRVI